MHIEQHAPIARYTSWQIGGTARYLLEPETLEDLSAWLRSYQGPTIMLGLGSNVLAPDTELDAAVVLSRSFLKAITRVQHNSWEVEAGMSCARLAREATQAGFRDAAFLCGIPGTIGGALRMNAGAFGGETWRHVDWVDLLNDRGECHRCYPDSFDIGYRHVVLPMQGFFVRAQFSFHDAQASSQQSIIADYLQKRAQTQPIGLPSCGSVFRNPYPQHAGALIESLGLKKTRIGGAELSEKHANFIINTGTARAEDVKALVAMVRKAVEEAYGIHLIPEFIELK